MADPDQLTVNDNRRHPRFRRQLSVMVDALNLVTANVSQAGLQLVCPALRYFEIREQVENSEFQGQVQIPGGLSFDAAFRVAYVSSVDDETLIGVAMTISSPNARDRWAQFIDSLS